MTNSYIALDLETTGLEARLEKITEIAALRVVDGRVEERFHSGESYAAAGRAD